MTVEWNTYPSADSDKLLAFSFAVLNRELYEHELAWRSFEHWSDMITRTLFPLYCEAYGPHQLPGKVHLQVRRHLKYYYDQLARDDSERARWERVP